MTIVMANEAGPGDSAAESLEAIVVMLETPLLAYAMTLLAESNAAQDCVQEAFVRLHENFDQVRQPRAWLYRTVHNLAANQRRKQRKIVPLTGTDPDVPIDWPDHALPPDLALQRFEDTEETRRCVAELDQRSREILRLKFDETLSYQEISKATGIGIGHVGYLLHHALKTLAVELKRKGIAP